MESNDLIRKTTILALVASNIISATSLIVSRSKKKQRSVWVRPYYLQRSETGAFKVIVKPLLTDPGLFRKYMRVHPSQFEELFQLVEPLISKQITRFRAPIPANQRLAIVLRYVRATLCLKWFKKSKISYVITF